MNIRNIHFMSEFEIISFLENKDDIHYICCVCTHM